MLFRSTTGRTVSATVTVEVQVFVFPFASVTVNVTVFGPTFAQVNESGVAESVTVVQLSLDPLLICAAVTEPVPALLSCTVLFWQIAVGRVVSDTVTVDVQVAVFPLASVTVSVTAFGPTFAHVKLSGVAEIVKVQVSVDALLICAAVTEVVPAPFKIAVRFWHIAVGRIVSCTVIVAEQVAVFP